MELTYAPGTTGSEEVLFATADGVGHILLNRPRAINALNREMCVAIHQQLDAWAEDPEIGAVLIRGAGERGLCAGGDVKSVRQAILDDPESSIPMDFFTTEYAMNEAIANYPKPYVAFMDGVTMGGGMGVSAHGSHRLVTPKTVIAMPETIIGFFPDVGILHLLARTPGEFGAMLAMTGHSIGAGDAIAAGLADAVCESPEEYAKAVAAGQAGQVEPTPEPTLVGQAWIDECFAGDDPVAILSRLKEHADPEAQACAEAIEARSPISVAVALRALRNARSMDVGEVLAQDTKLAERLSQHPDFVEGVRAQLVERGTKPVWKHGSLAEVTAEEVDAFFA